MKNYNEFWSPIAATAGGMFFLTVFWAGELVVLEGRLLWLASPLMPLLLAAGAAGWLARPGGNRATTVGIVLLILGSLITAAGMAMMAWFDLEIGWLVMAAGLLSQPVGWLVVGAANWRGRLFPRWNRLPLALSLLLIAGFLYEVIEDWLGIPWQEQSEIGAILFLTVLGGGWVVFGSLHLSWRARLITAGLSLALLVPAVLIPADFRFSAAATPLPASTIDPNRQIIFHNGVVLTMDVAAPRAEGLAVLGEKIEAVGNDETVLARQRPGAIVIDLQGRTLMPGFVDPHTHLFNDAEQYLGMSLEEVQQVALENGITTVGDLYVDERFLREIRAFAAAGRLQIRTSLYLVATDNCGRPLEEWWREHWPTRTPGEMLRIGGIKLFTDGGTCGRPALSYELTPGEGLGDLFFSEADLNERVAAVHAAGYQAAIHAIGDRAVEQAQNAIEAVLAGEPNHLRHRIEHNAVIRPELLPRYGEIGAIPIIFGSYPNCEPFGPPPPAAYESWEWPWRALLAANPDLPVAWHGDDPFFGRIRPLDDLYSLVTRSEIGVDGRVCPGRPWQAQHTLTADEALPLMTRNAAYALFREDEVGRLAPGLYADLLVLTADPTAVPAEEIPAIEVLLTLAGGRTVHCASGSAAICP